MLGVNTWQPPVMNGRHSDDTVIQEDDSSAKESINTSKPI